MRPLGTDQKPVVVAKVDIGNSKRAIANLSQDTLSTMDMQRLALFRLHQGCDAEWRETC